MKQFNLQFFAEDSAGDTSAVESPIAGDTAGSAEGTQQAAPAESLDLDELIEAHPELKQQYEAHLKEHIGKRFKNQKDNQAVIDRMKPFVAMQAQKYGIKAGENGEYDFDAITKAMSDDNALYEDDAFKHGMNVEDYKHLRQLEIDNEQLRRTVEASEQDAQAREQFNELYEQGEQLKTIYPNFDLSAELDNPQFATLIANGFPLQNAYESCHVQEIIAGGMQYAVQKGMENAAKSIQAGAKRPRENGLSAQSASNPGKQNISNLTREQLNDLMVRASAGEKITFR